MAAKVIEWEQRKGNGRLDNQTERISQSSYYALGERFATYRLEELLEEDPTGRIFRVYDEDLSRFACLKVLSSSLAQAPGFIDVLRIQLHAAESLNHPGIVVHELGIHQSENYMISEWSTEGWLSHTIVEEGRLQPSDAIRIITKCAEILFSSKESGVFHGNLKPSNILMFPGREVKIVEMGFAAAARVCFGSENVPVYLGATRFLAPEMTEPVSIDFRADIFSLGNIFYYLLFNTVPFRLDGQNLTLEEPLMESISKEILDVLSRMTERKREKRYQSYGSLLEDLKELQILHTQSVETPVIKNYLGGGIKSQNVFKLLCALYTSGITGVLTIISEDIQRKFFISNRNFIFFESNRLEESIWTWLVKKKEIDFQTKPKDSMSFESSLNFLLAKGVIKLEDFKYRYQELMNLLLFESLKWESADAEFMAAEIENEPLARIQLSEVLFKAVKTCVDFPDILAEIKAETVLYRTPLFESLLSGLNLGAEERQLAARTQDGAHIGTLLVTAGSVQDKPLRFLFLLKQIGALDTKPAAKPGPSGPSQIQELLPSVPVQAQTQNHVSKTFEDGRRLEGGRRPIDQEIRDLSSATRMEVQTNPARFAVKRLDEEAEKRFEAAKERYDQQKYWEAANLCEQALGLHENSRYYWLMGLSYSHHPKFRMKAEDCFHHAIHLDPVNDELHVELAKFYITVGLFLRAKTHCEMAMQILPDHAEAKQMLNELIRMDLGIGGCPCEHKPGCTHHH